MSISILVIKDTATPALARLMAALSPQRLAAAVGPACAREVQRHLRELGTNRKGWPTTHFWARAARATSWEAVDGGAMVRVTQVGVRQRYHGGPIAPVNRQALAIPISPVSYGHVPSDFPGLFVLKTKKGAYLVQHGEEVGGKGTKGARARFAKGLGGNGARRRRGMLNFLFKLSRGVNQAADPGVLPSRERLREVAFGAVRAGVKAKGVSGSLG